MQDKIHSSSVFASFSPETREMIAQNHHIKEVVEAAHAAVSAVRTRDEAIRAAHQSGVTIRAIAAGVDLSSARVHQILHHR